MSTWKFGRFSHPAWLLCPFVLVLALAACGGAPTAQPTAVPPTSAPTPTAAPTSEPGGQGGGLSAMALIWNRDGGLAGLCDSLIITADGQANASNCQDPNIGAGGAQPLAPELQAQLNAWRDQFAPFEVTLTDPATADALTVRLTFNGQGNTVAGEADQQAVAAFAAAVFADQTPVASGPCAVTARQAITLYQRPDVAADVFGQLSAGESVAVTARSAEGWLGFEPGVAQAANVGVFRLRWLPPDAPADTTGDCTALPTAPIISATGCYFMAMIDANIYPQPDVAGDPMARIPAGGFSAVIGRTDSGWYQLDLKDSSLGQSGVGWLDSADANFNGHCQALPTVTP